MFLEFYNLRQQPFGVTPDPAYLYLTRTHREALDSLLSGIKDGRGFFALIAEPGMGKTTLLYRLIDELHESARTVFLFQTQCDSREFFQYLLNELGVDTRGMDRVSMHSKLNEMLFAEMIAGRRFVLIVDEAQNLEDSVLETVRLLSNFETSYAKMLQIVLAGQPQLSGKLAQPQLAQLRQRLAVLSRLAPLSEPETAGYIDHRLKIGGYSGGPLFTQSAVASIAQFSRGIPRTINRLCYDALSTAHARGCQTVGPEIVREVAGARDCEPLSAEKIAPADTSPGLVQDIQNVVPAKAIYTGEHVQDLPPRPALSLTYGSAKRLRLPRWAFRAFLLTGLLVLAGISLTAFMFRLTEPGAKGVMPLSAPVSVGTSTNSGPVTPAPVGSPGPAAALSSPKSLGPEMSYSADPEEAGGAQIITVAAMSGQTIQDISLSYVGSFDEALLREIRSLNPQMKDPGHLNAGQLIRLPLPRGRFKKGKDLASEK